MTEQPLPPGQCNFPAAHSLTVQPGPATMTLTGQTPIVLLTPMSKILLGQAKQLSIDGQYQFAVVLAHAACELATEDALNILIRHRTDSALGEVLMSFVTNGCTLADRRVRKAYVALTGDNPAGDSKKGVKPAGWWDDWNSSRELRHQVAHTGARVIDQQAAACLAAVDAYTAHLGAIVASTTAPP